jgi:hypothetical protein
MFKRKAWQNIMGGQLPNIIPMASYVSAVIEIPIAK